MTSGLIGCWDAAVSGTQELDYTETLETLLSEEERKALALA